MVICAIAPEILTQEPEYYLFDISVFYRKELDNGNLTSPIFALFKENHCSLSSSASLELQQTGRWAIVDKDQHREYVVKDQKTALKVYEVFWLHPPTIREFLLLGTYKGSNLLFVVTQSARFTLYLSFASLFGSIAIGLILLFLDFYRFTRPLMHTFLVITTYCPRMFVLIFFSAVFALSRPSQLTYPVSFYLIALFGLTGSVFLASQVATEVAYVRSQLFVHFAFTLGYPAWKIFFRHILKNCITIPMVITKQCRDNILFLATLSFMGLVHLQSPTDFGALIFKYANDPYVLQSARWALFAPCGCLIFLLLLFDLAAENIARKIEKAPQVNKT